MPALPGSGRRGTTTKSVKVGDVGVTLEHDHAAFSRQVLTAGFMLAAMQARAEAGAQYARSIAPVETGAYRDSIDASAYIRHGDPGDPDGLRAVGRVEAGTDHAKDVEYGRDGKGHRVLGRALDAMRR